MNNKFLFRTDSVFVQGALHTAHGLPCQDYAHAGVSLEGNVAFLGLSDGCSGGGETDLGARLIVRKLFGQVKKVLNSGSILEHELNPKLSALDLESLSLMPEDALATALWCVADQSGVSVRLLGDGVIVIVKNSGRLELYRYEWEDSTPFYPLYVSAIGIDSGMLSAFYAFHKKSETPLKLARAVLEDGKVVHEDEKCLSLGEGAFGAQFNLTQTDLAYTKLIALFSDGVNQVGKTNQDSALSYKDVIQSCLDFKQTTGAFVKRRFKRQLQTWSKLGLYPQDDLSYAVLEIDHTNEDKN